MAYDLVNFFELAFLIALGVGLAFAALAALQTAAANASGSGELDDGGWLSQHGRHLKRISPPTASGGESGEKEEKSAWEVGGLSAKSPFLMPFWAFVGETDLDAVDSNVFLGAPLFFAYQLLCAIVLVNLLIAMLADTYSRIRDASQRESCFLRYIYGYRFRLLAHSLPPPFNLPLRLADGLRAVALASCQASADVVKVPTVDHWQAQIFDDLTLTVAYVQRFIAVTESNEQQSS